MRRSIQASPGERVNTGWDRNGRFNLVVRTTQSGAILAAMDVVPHKLKDDPHGEPDAFEKRAGTPVPFGFGAGGFADLAAFGVIAHHPASFRRANVRHAFRQPCAHDVR